MLKVDLYHTHPILKAFVQIAWETRQKSTAPSRVMIERGFSHGKAIPASSLTFQYFCIEIRSALTSYVEILH